jgi:hypothetical protein
MHFVGEPGPSLARHARCCWFPDAAALSRGQHARTLLSAAAWHYPLTMCMVSPMADEPESAVPYRNFIALFRFELFIVIGSTEGRAP